MGKWRYVSSTANYNLYLLPICNKDVQVLISKLNF